MTKKRTNVKRVLLITLEPIARQMAGPAIRCLELAKQLASNPALEVTVFSASKVAQDNEVSQKHKNLQVITGKGRNDLYDLARTQDIFVLQANVLKPYPALATMDKYIVVDLYDPYLFSVLVQYQNDTVTGSSSYRLMHQILEKHMVSLDFAICASERQRDYWLGRFCALGRITPEMYKIDSSLRKLVDVVPFGLPEAEPKRTGPGVRGRISGISQNDKILVWGGGIWDWFDPLTVIRAVASLAKEIPDLRLFFMGVKSPNPKVELMDMTVRARQLSLDLGVLDTHVFFGESWVGYEDRVNYLLDADAAVSSHFDVIETRFSFRTRILDYLWAGLPILTTGGDQFADLIEERGCGIALPYEDVKAWEDAIRKTVTDSEAAKKFGEAARNLACDFHWSKAAQPLLKFCLDPYHLPRFNKVTMPSLIERAHAVYSRGGKELVAKRSRELLGELLK